MTAEALEEAAARALKTCLGVRPGEVVLVVCDDRTILLGQAFYAAARILGNEPLLMVKERGRRDGEEPPRPVAAAMAEADVVVMPTTYSLSHTAARRDASARGARVASMPGLTADMMRRTFAADYGGVARRTGALAELLTRADTARILTPLGTDLTMSLAGREGHADTGFYLEPGSFGNLPAGEAYIAPVEGTAEGLVVIDGSLLDRRVDEPVRVWVEGGRAVRIRGGRSAAELERLLEETGGEAATLAELGIGTNDGAVVTGNVLEDEKVLGTVHVAFGDNASMGGRVAVPIHVDGVILAPTLLLDGRVVVQDGRLLGLPAAP